MKKIIISILTIIIICTTTKAQIVIDSSSVVKTCLDCSNINSNPLPNSPGSLYIMVSGGIPPYNFSLTGLNPANNTPSLTSSLTGTTSDYDTLCQDSFILKITDNIGDSLIYGFSTIPPPSPYLSIDSVTVKADSTNTPDSGFINLHVTTNADSVFYKIQDQFNTLSLGSLGGWQDSTIFDSLPGGYIYEVFVNIYPKISPNCGLGIDTGTSVFSIYVPLACENDGYAYFSPPTATCEGPPTTVSSVSYPGSGINNFITNILWDFGDGNFGTSPVATNLYANPGTYIVQLQVTTSHGCTFFDAQPVNIAPVPNTNYTYLNNGNGLVTFTDQSTIFSGNITDWFWDFGDGNNSTSQNPSYQYTTPGTYTVCLSTTNMLCFDTYCENIIISTVGINENRSKTSIAIYPNPTDKFLTYNIAELNVKEITIINLLGKTVKTITRNTNPINVGDLPNGVYFIQIKTKETTSTEKFVKN